MNVPTEIDHIVANLEAWLDTMRGPSSDFAYGGPVAHWWQQSLLYTGPGYDWRYQGIIQGYLTLWQRTQEPRWLMKARRAGDDLLAAHLPDGHYTASAFEINPASAGTPHEAAASLGLLELTKALKSTGQRGWEHYFKIAVNNLYTYYVNKLWDLQTRSFRDQPQIASFVPNKSATACQAFFLWSEIEGDERWAVEYALPNLDRIIAHQVTEPGPLQGAIAQNSFGAHLVPKYMPFYVARCIPALVHGYMWNGQERYLDAAWLALGFVLNQRGPGGGFLPVVYSNHQFNTWPQWVAALGDILLAVEMLMPYGFQTDLLEIQNQLISGQDISGGIHTASGFASQVGGLSPKTPDFRDLLHVVGWCDKAFHWLACHTSGIPLPVGLSQPYRAGCIFQRQSMLFYEDQERVQATHEGKTVYLWIKGEKWARQASPIFWLH